MATILLTTIITCDQAIGLVNRLQHVIGLNYNQKTEIIKELIKVIPDCPIIITPKTK